MDTIELRGARTHNLKNINLTLPREKLVVITGPSGSGKSSLAFDTLYAEGQRRYVESLSAYARQFLSMMEKPDIDHIEGLSPAISIEQKSTSHNPRSTVGTITEIYDYLRLLYARVGVPHCPEHGISLQAQTISQMTDQLLELPKDSRIMILAPIVRNRKGEHLKMLEYFQREGYVRARINGELVELDDVPKLAPKKKHNIDIVIDRVKIQDQQRLRLSESIEAALKIGDGIAMAAQLDAPKEADITFSAKFACRLCGFSLTELEPRLFSFNNPMGACTTCDGLGNKAYFDPEKIINPTLSPEGGAIRGWDKRHGYYFQMLSCVAKHYNIDLSKPFEELSQAEQEILLYGSGKTKIDFKFSSERGLTFSKSKPFEGVIGNYDRRYQETDSDSIRSELTKFLTTKPCPQCQGSRLNPGARAVTIGDLAIHDITSQSVKQAHHFFTHLILEGQRAKIAEKILKEIQDRLSFLVNVGLDYLTLSRSAETLSGGEAQRIRLASQIGAGLVGVLYILDEPTIGLHQRDNERLIKTLLKLRDLGNTVIVVEHDADTMMSADHMIDIGPGAGVHGGQITCQGTPQELIQHPDSLTGQYLSGRKRIDIPTKRVPANREKLIRVLGASSHNLKGINAEIPVGLLTCVTGVSGSGKSTLVNRTLYPLVQNALFKQSHRSPGAHVDVEGLEYIDKVVDIDQSPIGRTPRSNPATYTGIFTAIRELFAMTQEARSRGYRAGRFSFNVKGGRCEACQGDGVIRVEMHFLPDIFVCCDACGGERYNRETLDIRYKNKTILEVLQMTVEEACTFFENVPMIARKVQTLLDVGLGYIQLGQNATTLSGGEAQRVKLAKELSKRDTGQTLYILDEPTTGLHFQDIEHLLRVLHRLRDKGNTLVIIEHNLDVIKTADWIIDLGPEGGDQGGQIIATGTPESVARSQKSHTGRFLASLFNTKKPTQP